jgi:putative FmdB family regulatory protein
LLALERKGEIQCHFDVPSLASVEFVPACSSATKGYFHVMPIYEFHCEKCERDSEILVRSTDWKGTTCPHCGSAKLAKKLSVFAAANAGGSNAPSGNGGGGGCCGGHCHGGH